MGQRRAKGEERERAVVTAAAELIAEHGLAELRMADVADRAGMSVGHVTYYFPTKSELLVRAITQSEEHFQGEVTAALDAQTLPWRRLCTLVELAAATGPGDPGWLLWFEVWANAAVDEQVAAAQRHLDAWWRESLAGIVEDGIERGDFHCDDTKRAVAIISALTDGLSVRLVLDGQPLTRKLLLEHVLGVASDLLGVST